MILPMILPFFALVGILLSASPVVPLPEPPPHDVPGAPVYRPYRDWWRGGRPR